MAATNSGRTRASIEVLIAKNQSAVVQTCPLLGDPEGAGMAEVEITGGRRRQATTVSDAGRVGVVRDGPWNGHVVSSAWLVVCNRNHRDNFASRKR